MTYTDIELSKLLKVNRSTIFRWRTECGMPVDDLEAARAFAATRKPATKRAPKVEVDPVPVTGESVYDVKDRLHQEERRIAAEVAGLNVALEQARTLNDERGAFKLLQALKSTREDNRRQVDALLKSEARILLLEKSRGSLLDLDVCRAFVTQCLTPTIIWMRKLADSGRNPEERALLESLRDAGGASGEPAGCGPAHHQRFSQRGGKLQREGGTATWMTRKTIAYVRLTRRFSSDTWTRNSGGRSRWRSDSSGSEITIRFNTPSRTPPRVGEAKRATCSLTN